MTTKKTLSKIIALFIVLIVLVSHLFIIAEADHDCSGEDCPVCQIISAAEDVLRILSQVFCAAAVAAASAAAVRDPRRSSFGSSLLSTPVLLKVRLSN